MKSRSVAVRLLVTLAILWLVALILWTKRSPCSEQGESSNRHVAAAAEVDVDAGRRLYHVYCWFCHGTRGRGDGPVAGSLDIEPRDFSRADYKIRSTPRGALPTDEDLFLTITRGVPGTHMPGWHTLSEAERWQLVAFIKSFSTRFRTSSAPPTVPADDPLEESQQVVERGRLLYDQVKCWLCHGKEGRGKGPITTALLRQWGLPYQARNLRDGASYKGGSTVEDIFRTISTGFNGTPMGSHEHLLTERERWHVAHYVASLADRKLPRDTPLETGVSWQRGRWVFFGKGRCILCHKIEGKGDATRGPDLSEIGVVAATRRKGQTALDYIFESITKPAEFVVKDYSEHMPKINHENVLLERDEIRSLVVYLSAQGQEAHPKRSQLARLPDPPAPETAAVVVPELMGDPHLGWQVYQSDKAVCSKCHTLHGRGQKLGPDLTNLSSFQSRRQVTESLLEPNKVLTAGFRQFTILTTEGRAISGVVVGEDLQEIQLADEKGNVEVVSRELIDEMVAQKTSNMPADISKQLTEQQRADLIAFLLDQQPALDDVFTTDRRHSFVNPCSRPKNGPPLKNVVHKVGATWLTNWLKQPQNHDPNTFMPNLQLNDDEIKAIVAYLTAIADADVPRYEWEPHLTKPIDDLSDQEFDALDQKLVEGKRLWSESRCSICHRVGERGGIVGHAPALTNAGMKLRRDWISYWLSDPRYDFPGTQMPHFRFTLEQRKNLVAYLLRGDNFGGMDVEIAPDDQPNHSRPSADLIRRGRDVIERSRCTVCHDIPGVEDLLPSSLDWPEPRNDFELLVRDARCLTCHVINGEGGTFAPELTTVGSRLKRKWMEKFLTAPDVIRPLLKQMPKLNLTEAEARTVADYAKRNLTDPRIDPNFLAGYRPTPEDIQHGKQIYDAKGCNACHQIGLTGGAVGPTLTHVADRLEPGYIFQYLKNPQRFKPDVVEPNYGFTNTEAMRLTKYLLSLSAEQKGDE